MQLNMIFFSVNDIGHVFTSVTVDVESVLYDHPPLWVAEKHGEHLN